MLEVVRSKLTLGISKWTATGGKERTFPFQSADTMRVHVADPAGWLMQQKQCQRVLEGSPASEWISCKDLSQDRPLCHAMHRAALALGEQRV